MARIVIHNVLARDGVGTPEEVAYGEGWHSTQRGSPYSDPKLAAEWKRGRQDRETASKMRKNSYVGGIRGQAFKEPRGKNFGRPGPAEGHIADFQSERGYVARLVDVKTGKLLAKSEPHISNGPGLKLWIQAEARKLIAAGKRVQAEVTMIHYDPERVSDVGFGPRGVREKPSEELEKELARLHKLRNDSTFQSSQGRATFNNTFRPLIINIAGELRRRGISADV